MLRKPCCLSALLLSSFLLHSQPLLPKPLKLAVAGMTHGHVDRILERPDKGDIRIVGIYEPRQEVVDRYAKEYAFRRDLVFSDLEQMLDSVKPEAVTAFGSTYDHLKVVQACAPLGIHVMVEKPLAVSLEHALRIEALAKKHSIHVLTNYETTWYPSSAAVYELVLEQRVTGPIRKIVVHDGHSGPNEIHVNEEFLEWLTDPIRNGGGALMDFGCYGANLVTWLMQGAEPLTVTTITQTIKPEIYKSVEDEATIVLRYPQAQAIIQASWNWPFNRKDIEIYGRIGYVHALDGRRLRVRKEKESEERVQVLDDARAPVRDPFAYLASVVRGEVKQISTNELSSLGNNLVVMKILEAAKRSARSGQTVELTGH